MSSFFLYFLLCNLCISGIILLLLTTKAVFRHTISDKYQYRIWFLLFIPLLIPFLGFRPIGLAQWITRLFSNALSGSVSTGSGNQLSEVAPAGVEKIQDFSVSVSQQVSCNFSMMLTIIWIAGMIVTVLLIIRSVKDLYRIKESALPLENQNVLNLYRQCAAKHHIAKEIPLYSTVSLQSPALVGFFRPRIYLPLSLLSDYTDSEMYYILLHELQHYRQKDPLIKYLSCLFCIPYWFNPLVWYGFRVMHNDCEISCDYSVMNLLDKNCHLDYGNTLLNFAQKMSFSPISFANEMGGNHSQIRRRILHIASFQRETRWSRIKNFIIFILLTAVLLESLSFFPVYASEKASPLPESQRITYENYASFFQGYDGSFVLYDMETDQWQIYNKELATKRVSPDSTYKIYSGLMALENHLITPDDSERTWDGQEYPFVQWNRNQNLTSALQNSVNWYFQDLDREAGQKNLETFYKKIGYGNQQLSSDTNHFWMESTLKISPVEQVELLKKLYNNEFHFQDDNVQAILRGMRIADFACGTLYGKTGTGKINGENTNGWFIGYVTGKEHTWCFAVNIHKPAAVSSTDDSINANGATASEIALKILEAQKIYK